MNLDLKHYLSFIVGQALGIICSILAMALLARILGPEGLGRWAMITAAATLFHLIFINWIQQDPFLRFGKEEWIKTGGVRDTWSARLPLIILGLLITFLALIATPREWIGRLFLLTRTDQLLTFAFFICITISIEIQTLLQITGRMTQLALIPAGIAATSALFYLGLRLAHLSSHQVGISLLGTLVLTLALWIGFGVYDLRPSFIRLPRWNKDVAKTMLAYAWPIWPATLLGYCLNWGNQIIIKRLFSNHDVGLYQAAFQVHSQVVSLAVPYSTIVLPRLIGKHLEDPTVMRRYIHSIAPSAFCLWLLAMIPMITLLPFLFIVVYGHSFSLSLPILNVLLMATPLCALGQIYTVLYSVQGKMDKVLWILAFMLTVYLLATWIILPSASIAGIAGAFSAAFMVAQYATFYYQHRVLHEPALKVNVLFLSALIFSLGQLTLHSAELRAAWGAVSLGLLIYVARNIAAVDEGVLRNILTGRLHPLGSFLIKIIVPPEQRASERLGD